jgi:Tol biopolymer transport system component
VENDLPNRHEFEGKILLSPFYRHDPYILDLETGMQLILEKDNDFLWQFSISPDGRRLAAKKSFYDAPGPDGNLLSEWLIIFTSDMAEEITIPWGGDWYYIIEWRTNTSLTLSTDTRDLLVIDPFNNQSQRYSVNLSDVYSSYPPLNWKGYSSANYILIDSTLRFAVLPYKDLRAYLIWDLTSNQEITRLSGTPIDHDPVWLPDGTGFVFANKVAYAAGNNNEYDELFNFSLDDGISNQLTFLGESLEPDISKYSISPDGRYIALILSITDTHPDISEFGLAVYDSISNEITHYCIEAAVDLYPHWSPSGQQIMFLHPAHFSSTGKDLVVLVDINMSLSVQVAEDAQPMGWMTAVP